MIELRRQMIMELNRVFRLDRDSDGSTYDRAYLLGYAHGVREHLEMLRILFSPEDYTNYLQRLQTVIDNLLIGVKRAV